MILLYKALSERGIILEEKKDLKQAVKICTGISIAFVVVLAVSAAGQLLLVRLFESTELLWVKKMMQLFCAFMLASPFGIVIPLFFRVNFQNKLIMLEKKEKEEEK